MSELELPPQERVDLFDKNLKFLRLLHEDHPNVYLVEQKNKPYVFKWGELGNFNGKAKEANFEAVSLELLAGLDGVPRLHEDYGLKGGYLALLKEFVPGRVLDRVFFDGDLDEQILFDKLENLLNDFQARGVVLVDVHDENILVTPKNQPYFVDFGGVFFSGEKNLYAEEFSLALDDLESMFYAWRSE